MVSSATLFVFSASRPLSAYLTAVPEYRRDKYVAANRPVNPVAPKTITSYGRDDTLLLLLLMCADVIEQKDHHHQMGEMRRQRRRCRCRCLSLSLSSKALCARVRGPPPLSSTKNLFFFFLKSSNDSSARGFFFFARLGCCVTKVVLKKWYLKCFRLTF